MKSIIKHVLLTALRDWLYLGLLILIALSVGLSVFMGDTAVIEGLQVTTAYISGSSRMISVLGLVVFVCFYVKRSFDNKEVQFILSSSISRSSYFISLWLGFLTIALGISLLMILIMSVFTKVGLMSILAWNLSLFFEMVIVITFAALSSLILKSAVSAIMASFGFYFISRMMGFFVLMVKMPESFADIFKDLNSFMQILLKFISIFFPRLDLFSQSEWLIYGLNATNSGLSVSVYQTLIYVPLMLMVAFYDFNKKQF